MFSVLILPMSGGTYTLRSPPNGKFMGQGLKHELSPNKPTLYLLDYGDCNRCKLFVSTNETKFLSL